MVIDKMKEIVNDVLDIDTSEIGMESSITEDLKADSLDMVEIVMAIEDSFGITFAEEDIKAIKTVGDAVNYVESRINK